MFHKFTYMVFYSLIPFKDYEKLINRHIKWGTSSIFERLQIYSLWTNCDKFLALAYKRLLQIGHRASLIQQCSDAGRTCEGLQMSDLTTLCDLRKVHVQGFREEFDCQCFSSRTITHGGTVSYFFVTIVIWCILSPSRQKEQKSRYLFKWCNLKFDIQWTHYFTSYDIVRYVNGDVIVSRELLRVKIFKSQDSLYSYCIENYDPICNEMQFECMCTV